MPHRPITVLGVNDGHDCGAALVRDGKVVAAVQEERLTNIKHHSGAPKLSVPEVYKIAKIHPSETDAIAIVSLNRVYSPLEEYPFRVRLFEKLAPYLHGKSFVKFYVGLLQRSRNIDELKAIFASLGIGDKEVSFVEHHLTHASCAYRSAPWGYDEPVLVMTCDGAGDGVSSTVSVAEKGDINRIAWSTFYDSIGNSYYSEITRYLGMKPWDHEWKTMGLAPYGKPEYCVDKMKKIVRINPANPLEFQNTFGSYLKGMQGGLQRLLAGERFDNVAAACQEHYEDLVCKWVANAIEKTGVHKVAFAGGNVLNVKANAKVMRMSGVEGAFFYPAAGDDGTPVGAALQVYHDFCVREGVEAVAAPVEGIYHGPEYADEEIQAALAKTGGLSFEKHADIDGTVGDLLGKGKVVARFSGRVEWGPRALGNRSILADPRRYDVVRRINSAIKQRDFWMPFAPSMLEERMADYLVDPVPARYMITSFDTTERRSDIAAAIHPQDLTCRPQTLNHWNEGYRHVVESFDSASGVGGVLNTSFNLHGYPIAGTPEMAIWTFQSSKLDALAIGEYLLQRN